MTIRLARPDDVTDLTMLYHHLSSNYQDNPSAVEAAVKHPTTFVHVALQNQIVVGAATLSVRAVPSKGFVGYVDDVVVHPSYWGQGIAKALMDHLADAARQLDCVRIELTSSDKRTAARKMYAKLGYQFRQTNNFTLDL